MSEDLEIPADVLSLISVEGLAGAVDSAVSAKLARMRQNQKKGRSDLARHAEELTLLLDEAKTHRGASWKELVKVADILHEKRNKMRSFYSLE